MDKKILSICIPVYNRFEIFRYSLECACKACFGYEKYVEIIVSDNNSSDDIKKVFDEIQLAYTTIDLIYNRNEKNIGLAGNFLKVVELSSSEYCWIIGSDDFIKKHSVKELLSIITKYNSISLIALNFDLINLKQIRVNANNDKYAQIFACLERDEYLIRNEAPKEDSLCRFDELIDPKYNNVYLGAVMASVFKKKLWDAVDKSDINVDDFNSLESIYPHCYIFAIAFIGKDAYYCKTPLITVGEGTREWGVDTGNSYWNSSLPLIHFKIITDIIEFYKRNGLNKDQYVKCKRSAGEVSGSYFLPIISGKFFRKPVIKNIESMKIMKTFKAHMFNLHFYKGIILYLLRKLKLKR